MLRFRMDPKDDLSSRADFTYDLMQSLSKSARMAAESSNVSEALKGRADVDVRVVGSLNSIDIKVDISPKEGVTLPPEEVAKSRAEILEAVNDAIKASMSELLQASMKSARERS